MAEDDRLRWHCRRGMRELDVLLNRYLDSRYQQASSAEQAAFRSLLEWPDPKLFASVMGRETSSDEATARVLTSVRGGD